jgi:myo-inositol-1(or 4)-monophosphatase
LESSTVLSVARQAARAAVAVHRQNLGAVAVDAWTEKGSADFVTHVDREAERRAVECIRAAFPDHAILAEEEATAATAPARASASDWLWIIDPLDGTTNFLHRYPMYAASVAAVHRGEPVAAAVISGATGEEWTAVRGGGAYRDGERITVSSITRMPHALIGTGFPFKTLERLAEYTTQFSAVLRATAGIRRGGAAALDLCYVAQGMFDGFWELSLAAWDIAGGTLMVREAGGIVTRLDGDTNVLGPGSILAGNPAIHAALGQLLREVRTDAAGEAA